MIKREIEICGKKIPFRSSATIPRLYRAKFKRDIFKDLSKLEKSYTGNQMEGAEFQIEDLEIFENVAYIMAYHADNSIPATIEEWLDQFDMFSIYEVLPNVYKRQAQNIKCGATAWRSPTSISCFPALCTTHNSRNFCCDIFCAGFACYFRCLE